MNIEQIFIENSFKSKQKFIGQFRCALGIIGSPWWVRFNECDLEVFGLETFGHIEFWLVFVLGNLIKLQKWFW